MAINFERLTGTTFIARGPTNLGLYAFGENDGAFAVAIDSGGDEDAGRRVAREAERLGLRLTALLNTHSNADHCGGNAFLRRRTDCAIVATEIEAAFLQHPKLEPSFLAGGYPQKAIRNKFLMAPPSRATYIIEPPCSLALDENGAPRITARGGLATEPGPDHLSIVPLPGHYFGMIGAMTPDRVFFVADALAGAPIIEKYGVYFFYDLVAELETLSMLERAEADWFVPSHAEPVRDIKPLVALNRDKIFEIADYIVKLAAEGKAGALDPLAGEALSGATSETFGRDSPAESAPGPATGASLEDIVAGVCARYNIALNADQHVLVGSTVRSYLSWLCDQGRLEYGFERNRMIFRKPQ